jgi:methyl-accepting chemotaxis protein
MMSVNQKLILVFSLSVAIIAVVGGGAYFSSVKLIGNVAANNQTRSMLVSLGQIHINAAEIAVGARGYVATGNQVYLEPYRERTAQLRASIRKAYDVVADNAVQRQRLADLEGLVEAHLDLTERFVGTRTQIGFEAAQLVITDARDKKVLDRIRDSIETMVNEEERRLAEYSAEVKASVDFTKLFAAGSAGIGLILLALIGTAVSRTVAAALQTLVETATALSSGASEQVAAVTQTMSTLEEIKSTSNQTQHKSNALNEASTRTREEAQRGLDVVRQSIEAMIAVRSGVGTIAQMNLALSEQTKQIGEITQVVAKLAQESKMLALNASIEAVKAGDAGKGFSVVAAAIRSLAEQSEDATTQVQKILGDIRGATDRAVMATEEGAKQVDQAVELVEQSGGTINSLNEVVQETEAATQQIGAAVRQENIAIEQIASAMSDIRSGISQIANASDMTRSAAQRLTGNAQRRSALSLPPRSEFA